MSSTRNIISGETKVYGIALVVLVAALILLENWMGVRVSLKNIEIFLGLGN